MRYTISLLLTTLAAPAALADAPRVMTDIPVVQSIAAMVMGDLGTPGVLLDRGADAHDFQLRPSQAVALAESDLVIWVGPEMTPWLDRALDAGGGDGARLGLLGAKGTVTRTYAGAHEDGAHEDGAHDHAAEEAAHAEGEAGHDHEHDGLDPHAWLDPANAGHWAGLIADELSRIDPTHAEAYAVNADRAQADIAALDTVIAARLAPLHDRPFVVFHDAYGYFADHYGLTITAAVAMGDAAAPGAAHLREVQESLTAAGATCIFPEANHDPKLVAAVAEGTGARIGGALDPEGSAIKPGPQLYATLLGDLATALEDCLSAD